MRITTLKAIFSSVLKTRTSLSYSLFAGLLTLLVAQTAQAQIPAKELSVKEQFAKTLSAKIELSSDRIYRGVAQTDNNLAPSFNTQYSNENGLYLGVQLSRNDFRTPNISSRENAYFLGYGKELNKNLDLDISYIAYDHSKPETGPSRDWQELHLRLSFASQTALILGIANDWLRRGTYTGQIEVSHLYPLAANLSLQGTGGIIFASNARGDDYLYAELGLIYGLSENVYIRADLTATDSAAKRLFGDRAGTDARISIGYVF